MKVSFIVATTKDRVIGRDGGLPWPRIPADMRRFRELTIGKPCVMGSRTFLSLRGFLDHRDMIVLSRDVRGFSARTNLKARFRLYGVGRFAVVPSLDFALGLAEGWGHEGASVIGGQGVYAAALPMAEAIHLTLVDGDWPGDTRWVGPMPGDPGWRAGRVGGADPEGEAPGCEFWEMARIEGVN